MFENKNKKMQDLIDENIKLKLDLELANEKIENLNKDNLINELDMLKKEWEETIQNLNNYKKEYKKLIDSLKDVERIVNEKETILDKINKF